MSGVISVEEALDRILSRVGVLGDDTGAIYPYIGFPKEHRFQRLPQVIGTGTEKGRRDEDNGKPAIRLHVGCFRHEFQTGQSGQARPVGVKDLPFAPDAFLQHLQLPPPDSGQIKVWGQE